MQRLEDAWTYDEVKLLREAVRAKLPSKEAVSYCIDTLGCHLVSYCLLANRVVEMCN